MITISVKRSLNGDLLEQWHALWKKAERANFFNTPEWLLAYCESFDIHSYTIITAEEKGRLLGVLPLIKENIFMIPALVSPGGKFLDKSSLLVYKNDPELLQAIVKKLMGMGNFYLHELSQDVTKEIISLDKRLTKQEGSINPYIPLIEYPFQFLANDDRNKIFNRVKRNEEHLIYKCYIGDPTGLEIAFALDQKSYKRTKGKGAFASEKEKTFFRNLLARNKENFVVNVLFNDNVPMVYDIGYLYRKIYQGVVTGYDGDYRQLSPGKMLLYFVLRHFKEEGYEYFDFSRGTSILKREFTDLSYLQYDVFYTQNEWVKQWWDTANSLYNYILNHKVLYGTYLRIKKLVKN